MSDAELPRDVLDNPFSYEKLLRLYAPRNLALGLAVPAVLTALHTAANAARGPLTWERAALPWALAALLAPWMAACGAALRARRRRAFLAAWWGQSVAQFVWLQYLCWSGPAPFAAVGAAVFCVWAFNDAFVGYDGPVLKAQYLAAFPAFDVALLALDGLGGRGLAHAFRHERAAFDALLVAQAALALVTQTVLYYAGTEAHAHDRRVLAMSALERDLAAARAERRALQRANAYLAQGIAATRFCHDVRSPLQVVTGNAALLRGLLARPPHEDDDALAALAAVPDDLRGPLFDAFDRWFAEAHELLGELARDVGRLEEMTRAVAVAIRDPEAQRVAPASELVAEALREMREALAGHRVEAAPPALDVEDVAVAATAGHAATLGALLANGALQRPEAAGEVRGRAAGRWFYHFALRDHGVAAAERAGALERIRRSLSLEAGDAPDTGRARAYGGYGIALMIAKVFLARYGGAIAAAAPPSGDGVVFHVLVPRVPYDQVPAAEGPEDALAAAMGGGIA